MPSEIIVRERALVNHSEAIAKSMVTEAVSGSESRRLLARVLKRHRGERDFVLDVNFAVASGFTILFGASGSGKTTLLDCIAGLISPDSGTIRVGSKKFFDAKEGVRISVSERSVGYVFQDLALFPHLTVGQNVAYGLNRSSYAERRQKVN